MYKHMYVPNVENKNSFSIHMYNHGENNNRSKGVNICVVMNISENIVIMGRNIAVNISENMCINMCVNICENICEGIV